MLEEVQLLIKFWNEAVEADSYMQNHTNTRLVINSQKTCLLKAFTREILLINYIYKQESKCFYYINKKIIPTNEQYNKLVNPGRVRVFIGYLENTTKHFKVYLPECDYTIILSRVLIKESVKGGTIDLRIQNYATGSQGTPNTALNRKSQGRPKGVKEAESALTIANIILRVEIPAFTLLTNVLAFNKENMPDYEPPKLHIKPIDQTVQSSS